MAKQTKLTRAARGQEFTMRLYPYCNGNIETTVFAHAPSPEKGMGIKSPNWWGVYACSTCHDILDGRQKVKDISHEEVLKQLLNALFLTMQIRIEEQELIKVAE